MLLGRLGLDYSRVCVHVCVHVCVCAHVKAQLTVVQTQVIANLPAMHTLPTLSTHNTARCRVINDITGRGGTPPPGS